MALETSGTISLGGNSTGRSIAKELNYGTANVHTSQIELGQTSVRTLAGRTGNTTSISFSHLHGKSSVLDTQTLVVGSDSTRNRRGFANFQYAFTGGSMSDGTANWKSGAAYRWCYHDSSSNRMLLALTGVHTNSGFTSFRVSYISGDPSDPTVTIYRNHASSFATNGYFNYTSWSWNGRTQNPYGTINGPSKKVEFF
jgi:hypothetical protein